MAKTNMLMREKRRLEGSEESTLPDAARSSRS